VREEARLHVPRRHGAGRSGLRLGSERRGGTRAMWRRRRRRRRWLVGEMEEGIAGRLNMSRKSGGQEKFRLELDKRLELDPLDSVQAKKKSRTSRAQPRV
jgi:hypothetical protein